MCEEREEWTEKNSWWVCDLLAADCEKVWLHQGWEKYNAAVVRLLQGKKKDEKKRMKEERQKLVGRMMSSAKKEQAFLH